MLSLAVRNNDANSVLKQVEKGHKQRVFLHRHALHLSVRQGSTDITSLLLEYGCDPNMKDHLKRRAPIHYAVMKQVYLDFHITEKYVKNEKMLTTKKNCASKMKSLS